MFPIQGTKASVVVHERLGGMLYNSNRAGQSGSSNVTSSHQISDYRRPKSTWTRLHWNPFGGSSSVVQRPPAQKVVVHERLGGMLCITRIDRVKVVVVMSPVATKFRTTGDQSQHGHVCNGIPLASPFQKYTPRLRRK